MKCPRCQQENPPQANSALSALRLLAEPRQFQPRPQRN
jgi:hypothetical protein